MSPYRLKPPPPLAKHMGDCQNYGPLLGPLNIRCRTIIGIQKGTIILTTTHINRDKKRYFQEIIGNGGVAWHF